VSQPGKNRRRLTLAQKVVLLLSLLPLALGLGNLVRLGGAVYFAARLPDLPMTVSWTYLAAMGGFWGTVFIACVVGLVRFRPWGCWGTLVVVTLYEAHIWLNHLFFDASDYARMTWPRNLVLTTLLLLIVWGTLSFPSVRRVFRQ
jgi:hypothetical protein